MKKLILGILFLIVIFAGWSFVIPQKTFAASPYRGGEWVTQLLGGVFDQTSAYASCPSGYKAIGVNGGCGDPKCTGGPTYTITWFQPDRNDSSTLRSDYTPGFCEEVDGNRPPECFIPGCIPTATNNCFKGTNNACWDGKPRYTFEWSSIPIGSPTGEPVIVTIKVDDPNFKLTHWSLRTSTSNNTTCVAQTGGAFEKPSNEQTLNIKVYKNGDCKWNHLGFHRVDSAGGGVPVTLKGRVVDEKTGKGISGVPINGDPGNNCTVESATSDNNGNFTIDKTAVGAPIATGTGFCLRVPQSGVSGYTLLSSSVGKGNIECQIAGGKFDPDACKNTGGKSLDLTTDDAYEFVYTPNSITLSITPSTSPPNATSTPILPTPPPSSFTAFYRVATAPFGVNNDPEWKVYTDDAGMLEDMDFGNVPVGSKLIVYAQFKNTTGQIVSVSKAIDYIGPDPNISSIECNYSPAGDGTEVKITGQNFGSQGSSSKVNFNNKNAQILSWGKQTASESATTSTIVAKIGDKLKEDMAIPVFIETGNNRRAPKEGQLFCTIKATTVSFNTMTQCRPPQKFGNSNVRLQIYEQTNISKVKPLYDQKITINADGTPVWTAPILEVGKNYVLVIKGPQGLGYKKEFTATEGSSALSDLTLPVGDIAPLAAPDNVVNSIDYSELKKEWNPVTDVTRVGDFNLDSRVNSIDYSCMRNSFNVTGAKFLTGQ